MFPRHSILYRMLSVLGLCALMLSSSFGAAPTTPAAFKATALAYNKIALSLVDSSNDETGFEIEMKVGTGPFGVLGSLGANTTTGLYSPATASTQYTFQVRAYNQTGPSGGRLYSAYRTATAITTPTAATKFDNPSSFTASATASAITLNWVDNSSAETGFEVYAKFSSSSQYSYFDNYAANATTSGAETGFSSGTSYDFGILAYKQVPSAGGGTDTFYSSNTFTTVTVVTKDAITSIAAVGGFVGTSVVHTFTNSSASPVTSRVLTGVPPSLSFNAATGVLSGNLPSTPGVSALNYTVNFANGWSQQQSFKVRAKLPSGAPAVGTEVPDWTANAGATRNTSLTGAFSDVEAESAVRVTTTSGAMDFILYNSIAPATVMNFMNYVNRGDYTNVAFHRSAFNFVIQGGAFRGTGTGANFDIIPTDPPVVNEPGLPNVRGTISMAKLGGDPNSATNQFFVSLNDNRANLDFQNGGFTVFGRVGNTSMPVADAIAALPVGDYNCFMNGSPTPTEFKDFPVDAAFAPLTLDQTQTNLVKILSVAPIPVLQLTVTGNTNPSVATAAIVSGELQLSALAGGETSITVTATDLDGQTATQTVEVAITDTFATWSTRQTFLGGLSGSGQNPDGDGLSNLLEYAFLKDPAISDGALLPAVAQDGTAPAYLTISFPVRKFTTGLTYEVEGASSLDGPWTDVWKTSDGFAHAQVLTATDAADHTDLTIRDTQEISSTAKRFLRVRVTEP